MKMPSLPDMAETEPLHKERLSIHSGTEALQWINSSTTTTVLIDSCRGDNLTFYWTFQLDSGEQLEDIKWLYTPTRPPGAAPDLLANYLYGHFHSMPSHANRLVYLGNGNLALNRLTPADDGTYIVEVVTTHSGGSGYSSARQQVQLEVLEAPSTIATSLSVEVDREAVYDNVTAQWHVLLTCGRFVTQGNSAPPNVIWKTPSGSDLASSFSTNGTFYLKVPNPLEPGNYSCLLPHNPAAARCLPPGHPSLVYQASLTMDHDKARLLLLEAKQEALLDRNQQLAHQLTHTADKLAQIDAALIQTRQDLNATTNALSKTEQELAATKNSLSNVENKMAAMQMALTDLKNCCRASGSASASAGIGNGLTTISTLMANSQNSREIKNSITDIRGELKNVKREVKDLVKGCCREKQTLNQILLTGPGKTSTPHEFPTSPGTAESFSAEQSTASSTLQPVRSYDEWALILQDLTEHINTVESALNKYQALCSQRIAFHVQASHQQYHDNDHVKFDGEVFLNEGGAFNETDSEFVTPADGLYVFLTSTSAYGVVGASSDADLMVDDRVVTTMLGSHTDVFNRVTSHAVLHLHKGERVWVRSVGDTDIDTRSIFSGFLLKPDRP